jgi:hypothetical protein
MKLTRRAGPATLTRWSATPATTRAATTEAAPASASALATATRSAATRSAASAVARAAATTAAARPAPRPHLLELRLLLVGQDLRQLRVHVRLQLRKLLPLLGRQVQRVLELPG